MTNQNFTVALLPGDGIGPEVVTAARTVLEAAAEATGVSLEFRSYDAGAAHYAKTGASISDEVMDNIGKADAVLLGAMGLPNIRKSDGTELTPQIEIREQYQLFASLRPCKLMQGVVSRLKVDAIDMLVIRETTEGLFAGRHHPVITADSVSDTLTISRQGCERLFVEAFTQARLRKKRYGTPGHVTLLDKSNVLASNAFMRSIFDEVAQRYPDIDTDRQYIDAGSMMFVTNPERFDVVVTENVFGDIVSEIGAGVIGGLGLAPSADVGAEHAVFQPSHGSAPDIAGKGVANPIATMLSAVMLLEWLADRKSSDNCLRAAHTLRGAIEKVLNEGPRTRDLGGSASTVDVTEAVVQAFQTVGRHVETA
jgi:3-isopropylmalate dehydrogenase